jgi:hypothetical protein
VLRARFSLGTNPEPGADGARDEDGSVRPEVTLLTFSSLGEALRAGYRIFDKHPEGYLVRKEMAVSEGRRYLLAVALMQRSI